jgi:magnesium-transporting ATPase (P-type)
MSDAYGWGRPGFIPWVVVLAVMLLLSGFTYLQLPPDAKIPMQVDFQGNLQNYQSKTWALFFLPVLLALLALVMNVVPFVPYSKSEQRPLVWYAVLAVLFLCHLFVIVNGLKT